MILTHCNRKVRKRIIRDYYGFLPDEWETMKEIPNTNKEEVKVNNLCGQANSIECPTIKGRYLDLCIIDDVIVEAKCAPQPVPCCAPAQNTKNFFKKGLCVPTKKEEENSMTANTERTYLNNRANDVFYAHHETIADKFRIRNSDQPKTYKELIDAIKNDKYTIVEKDAKRVDAAAEAGDYIPWVNTYGLKFNLPTAPDWDGYRAADTALTKARTIAKDIINTQDAAAGLKALQDFEAWTPEGKAS